MAGVWLSRANFAKRTTEYADLAESEKRLADMFALRYGVDGEANTTLQTIGDRFGLTRERIRQVVAKMTERADRMSLKTPTIDRLADLVKPHLPATVESLDAIFRDVLGEALSLESVDRFCREILGRTVIAMTARPADMALSWSPTVIDPDRHDAEHRGGLDDVGENAGLEVVRDEGRKGGEHHQQHEPDEVIEDELEDAAGAWGHVLSRW